MCIRDSPIIGLLKSSSLNPTALNIDLLGDLCTPWVIADDLSLFILFENLFYSIAPTLQVVSLHQQSQNLVAQLSSPNYLPQLYLYGHSNQ